jgi:ribose transport system permease protein
VWRRWLAAPEASVLFVLVALLGLMASRGILPRFLSEFNQESLGRSISLQGILAVGVLVVILTGGIDLSLGSLVAFAGMLLAVSMTRMVESGMPVPQATVLGIALVLAVSLALGLVHAALIHFLKLPSFVVTLASMSMLRSGALLLNNAVPLPIEKFDLVKFLGNGKVYVAGTSFGIPVPAVVLILIAAVMIAILTLTRVGRRVYAVGSNEEASRLSGVNVFTTRLFVYGACSLLSGLVGIMYAGYGGQGDPSSGVMYELNAISAAVIGGAVLTGGRGSVIGTLLGAALLEWILNMINLGLLPITNTTLWRGMVVGGVLLAAVVFNQMRQFWGARRAREARARSA